MTTSLKTKNARSVSTQKALMLAAEKLIATKGIHNVSIRDIVIAAGQKNESALQYHFKSLQGLIDTIQAARELEIQEKRGELLAELLARKSKPSLRDLCCLMVKPAFLLAKADPGFRRFIVCFAHEVAVTSGSALKMASSRGAGGKSGKQTGQLLRESLKKLDQDTFRQRMEIIVLLGTTSMGHHARQKSAFRGASAELFLNRLIDSMVGLLGAPLSSETKALQE